MQIRHPGPVARHDPGGDRARAGDADLLADDGPYAGLERIPGAGWAIPRTAAQERADHGVRLQVAGRRLDIGVQVENSSGSLDYVDQALPVRQVGTEHEMIWPGGRELEDARVAVDQHRSPVGVAR